MNKTIVAALSAFVLLAVQVPCSRGADDVIRIGFNLPLTGMFALVGKHSKDAAELVRRDVESAGGLSVGGKKYRVEFIYGDNTSSPSGGSALTVSLVSKDKVLGIVGPQSSSQAIPAGQIAQAFSTPMISPWSTSPQTTKDRSFVFRCAFVFTIQGSVITKFVAREFNATRAGVLFDITSAYPRGMASSFREAFEAQNGAGSVVAYEEFRTGDSDFRKQLGRIKEAGAQVIFVPQHFNEVPLIVRQAKELGVDLPIVGSNSWAGGDLVGECGADCYGLYFTGNYAPGGAKGVNADFVQAYRQAYGEYPDEPAALTWDGVRVLLEAIRKTGGLSGNLLRDRVAVRDAMTAIRGFEGAAGEMTFNAGGDPSKCAVIVKISDTGVYTAHDTICP